MESNIIEKTAEVALPLVQLTHEARTLVNDVLEDGKRKAQRTAKRAAIAAEDCVEDTTYFIKRHPWQSVSVAAGFGVGVGLLAGWLLTRATRGCAQNNKREFQAVER